MELRRGGFGPRAWHRFLTDSRRRSRTSRAQRPLLARQARRRGMCGAVGWVMAWCAGRRSDRIELHLLPGLAWWLAVWQMLDWHLGMAEGGDGAPRPALSAADAMTLSRFWLTATLPGVARSSSALTTAVVVGGATDWLDGAWAAVPGARASGETSTPPQIWPFWRRPQSPRTRPAGSPIWGSGRSARAMPLG